VVCNINVTTSGKELTRILNHSQASLVITLDLFLKNVVEAVLKTPIKNVLMHSVFGLEKELAEKPDGLFISQVNDLIRDNLECNCPMDCAPDDIAVLQFTSGVTGLPKAAVLTHRTIVSNILQIDSWNPVQTSENRANLCIIPFFHVFGMTICMHVSIYRGYQMVLFPMFDWSSLIEILDAVKTWRPISFPAVPALWAALVSNADIERVDLSSIEIASGGGSSLPQWVQEKYQALTGKTISQAYGQSEASSTILITPFYSSRISQSAGIPLPDTDVKIMDVESGTSECKPGEIGEIIVSGPQIMKGYWLDEEKTKQALRNGWLYTGDLGYMDDDGFFFLVDRKDDLIISSGYNVYPSQIEEVLKNHPGIKEVVVAGLADPLRGQVITAFIVSASDQKPDRKSLISFCRNHLPDYKIPRFFKFREDLPKNKIGKPLRRLLKDSNKG
jgi:long-chain acyl-CoA synthetase